MLDRVIRMCCCRRYFWRRSRRDLFYGGRGTDRERRRRRGNRVRERNGRDGVLDVGVQLQLADFIFNLRLELAAGALEFGQTFANLPSNFRQFLRPKDDQGQNKDEHHLWETEIHRVIISLGSLASNGSELLSG